MKAQITAVASLVIFGCGAALASNPSTSAYSSSASACTHARQKELTGTTPIERCRAGLSRASTRTCLCLNHGCNRTSQVTTRIAGSSVFQRLTLCNKNVTLLFVLCAADLHANAH